MAYPTPYNRSYSFTDYQTANPADPLPGDQVDAELNAIEQTLDQTNANLELIQKSDGTLQNNTVGVDQLKSEVTLGFNTVSDWQTGTVYAVNDGVWVDSNKLYRCLVAQTSTVFATDLAASKWEIIVDFSTVLSTATTAATNASNSATAAAASYDSFDDRYLGAKSSDPSVDNDGNALLTGALYFSTVTSKMRVYTGAAWADATATANVVHYHYIASGGQTTFSGLDQNGATLTYTVGAIEVYVNGIRQLPADFTATNGTSVVFGSGLTVSDEVLISSFTAFTINDQNVFYQAWLGAQYYG